MEKSNFDNEFFDDDSSWSSPSSSPLKMLWHSLDISNQDTLTAFVSFGWKELFIKILLFLNFQRATEIL